jgi:hypothetical protein
MADTTPEDSNTPSTPESTAPHGTQWIDDMDDSHDCPSVQPLREAILDCQTEILPAFRRADKLALGYRKWYQVLAYAAAIGGVSAVLLATLQLSELLRSSLVWKIEAVAAFLTLLIVLIGMALSLKDRWLLERYKAERLRMLKFCFIMDAVLWDGRPFDSRRLKEDLVERVEEITACTFSALQGWVTRSWVPRVHEVPGAENLPPQSLDELVHYYRKKRLHAQMEYLAGATTRNFFSDVHMRLTGSALFFGSVAFVLAHLAVQWSRGEAIWSRSFMLVAATLPVLGAGFRTLRTAHEYARNASRFEATHDALSALSERLRNAKNSPAIFRELGFCEQVLESDLREWMRLMVEAEWFG